MRKTACVILAAGRGTRMRSLVPKVLHPVSGHPMLFYPVEISRAVRPVRMITVVGFGGEAVASRFRPFSEFVWQRHPRGTADALWKAEPLLTNFKGDVVVLCGDAPLLNAATLKRLVSEHRRHRSEATVLSAHVPEPEGYGRIIRDDAGGFEAIREEKDAGPDERKISEINTGAYVFYWPALKRQFGRIRADNRQREFYLTDAPELMKRQGLKVKVVSCTTPDEAVGINTRVDLAEANKRMNQRILQQHMLRGVTIIDPSSTFIEHGVKIGRDTTIYPFTYIEKKVRIGRDCSIGPFCKIRSGSTIGDRAVIGSFVEVVRSKIGRSTFVKHLSYIGDARLGDHVNVGAGTVTANYDGQKKHKTSVGDHAFIGCNTVLVAPVRIGARSKTGAGSVVPKGRHVKPGTTVAGVPARLLSSKKNRRP